MQLDMETVESFIAGDSTAFKTVYESTKRSIYSVIYRLIGNQHDAEDIMHDVYIRIFEKRKTYKKEKASLHTWIYRSAVNYTLNILRKNKRWSREKVIEEASEDLLEGFARAAEQENARAVLELVNPDFRACLVLRELEEKSYTEIAKILNISEGTVRSRINRGRKELKQFFEKKERGEIL